MICALSVTEVSEEPVVSTSNVNTETEATLASEMLVTNLHGVTAHKNITFLIFTA
jgi:hypothetical protein